MCLPPGRHLSLRCGHSRGFCGTLGRTSWISPPSCRSSMILCRRWEREQVVEFMRKIDALALDELVIAVPKISLLTGSQNAVRVLVRAWQTGWWKCLRSYSSLQQRTSEQIIDIPVPQGRGGRGGFGGLQGVSQGQGSTAFSGADHVDFPVPRCEGLQGFLPRQGSTASSSSSHVRAGAADEQVRGGVRTRGRNWVRTLIHGLWRLVPSPWRALTTSLRRSRRRRWWWRMQRLALQLAFGLCGSARGSSSTSWDGQCGGANGDRCTLAHSWAELHPEASAHEQQLASYFPD